MSCRKGFTATEFIMAVGIGIVIVAGAATTYVYLNKRTSRMSQRLIGEAEGDVGLRTINQEFSNSYIERLGLITCENVSNNSNKIYRSMDSQNGNKLSIFHSIVRTAVGVDRTQASTVVAPDADKFMTGDLVLLIDMNNSSNFGLFSISEINQRKIKIQSENISLSNTKCTKPGTSQSAETLFSRPRSTLFQMHRVALSTYYIQQDPSRRGIYNVNKDIIYSAGAKQTVTVFRDVKLMDWTTRFLDSRNTNEISISKSGRYEVALNVYQFKIGANLERSTKSSPMSTLAAYNLAQTVISNFEVDTTAPTIELLFPTCSVVLQKDNSVPLDKAFPTLSDPAVGFTTSVYKMSGSISEPLPGNPAIDVNIRGMDPAARGYCKGISLGIVGPSPVLDMGDTSIMLNPLSASTQVCGVAGPVFATGFVKFFDTGVNRIKEIQCSSSFVETPAFYYFQDAANLPRCTAATGDIYMGSALRYTLNGQEYNGPNLTASFCQWGTDTTMRDCSCNGETYCSGITLTKMYLGPLGLKLRTAATATVDWSAIPTGNGQLATPSPVKFNTSEKRYEVTCQ